MLEMYGFYLLVVAALVGTLGFLWLVVRAFRQRLGWGLAVLLFPPAGLPFALLHVRKAAAPLLVLLLAGGVAAASFGLGYYERQFLRFRPYEQVVGGELRLTLTGAKGLDYAGLKDRRDLVVLQMANGDVTDATLEHLRGLGRLRTLDVSGSAITDEGLRTLAELPGLQELYLARTKITDEGFRKYLLPKESLRKVDLTGTDVKGKTKREWKNARPDERAYVD